jgi:ERAP1-like C-terminal domain
LRQAEIAALLASRSPARTSTVERRVLITDIDAAVARDQLTIAEALAMVPSVLADREERIQNAASALARSLRADALDADTYDHYERWILATYGPLARQLGWRRQRGDSDERQQLRGKIVLRVALAGDRRLRAEAARLARAWLEDAKAMEDDIVEPVLAAATAEGDAALFEHILVATRAEEDRTRQLRLLTALGGFRDPALVQKALALAGGKEFDLRETRFILIRLIHTRETRAQAWKFVQTRASDLLSRMRSDEASVTLEQIGSTFCDEAGRHELSAVFTPLTAKMDGGQYALAQALDEVARCITTQGRIRSSAAEFLARY